MSSIAYGLLVREQKDLLAAAEDDAPKTAEAKAKADENKLVTAVAALIPAEVLGLHALILTKTTSTSKEGVTTITHFGLLKWSLVGLVALAVGVYLIGRGFKRWRGRDYFRAALPGFAVLVWTAIIGTSALTPWVMTRLDPTYLVIGAGAVGVVLVAVSRKINPPAPH